MARVWMVFLLLARSDQIRLNESAPTSLCLRDLNLNFILGLPSLPLFHL
jgi:hypothetical protein